MPAVAFYVLIGILCALIAFTWIPWRDIFEKLYGNNPLKAKVYVESGEQIVVCNGEYTGDTPDGMLYYYKYKGLKGTVFVPWDYPYRYIYGRRQIRVIWGHADASPLGGMTETRLPQVTTVMLNNILSARIGAELVKGIFGKAVNWMMIIIIIGALIFGGIFFYNNIVEKSVDNNPQQTEQPAETGDWPEG